MGRLGFEPTALGVSQATLAILQYHGEAQAVSGMSFIAMKSVLL